MRSAVILNLSTEQNELEQHKHKHANDQERDGPNDDVGEGRPIATGMITEAVLDAEYPVTPIQQNMIPRRPAALPVMVKSQRVHLAECFPWRPVPEWRSGGIAKRLVEVCALLPDRADQFGIGVNILE
jgi:hypothetical protein